MAILFSYIFSFLNVVHIFCAQNVHININFKKYVIKFPRKCLDSDFCEYWYLFGNSSHLCISVYTDPKFDRMTCLWLLVSGWFSISSWIKICFGFVQWLWIWTFQTSSIYIVSIARANYFGVLSKDGFECSKWSSLNISKIIQFYCSFLPWRDFESSIIGRTLQKLDSIFQEMMTVSFSSRNCSRSSSIAGETLQWQCMNS